MLALARTPSGPDTVPTSRPLADCPKLVGTTAKKASNNVMPIPFMITSLNLSKEFLLAFRMGRAPGIQRLDSTDRPKDSSKENGDQIIQMRSESIGLRCG